MGFQQGQRLGQQVAAMAEEQPVLLGSWGLGEVPDMGHGTGWPSHRGLPSSAPARGQGGFVRGCRDSLQFPPPPVESPSGFSTLQLPAKTVGDVKEICGTVFGGMGPAWRWPPCCGSLCDGTAISQESEGSSTALSRAAPRGNWSEPFEMR